MLGCRGEAARAIEGRIVDEDHEVGHRLRDGSLKPSSFRREKVPVLISGLGSPKAVVPEAHDRGIYVMSVVGAVRHAQKAVADGVDAVIATGCDGGGHVGRIGTAALIPAVVDAVDVPVLAGGGLTDGRGLAAAMAFGAQGLWMGTRFIATEESFAHRNYKDKIVDTDTAGTVITTAHSGKPCRLIRNLHTVPLKKETQTKTPGGRCLPLRLELPLRFPCLPGDAVSHAFQLGRACRGL